MHLSRQWLDVTQARVAVEALRRNCFETQYVEDSSPARQTILPMIPSAASTSPWC